VNPNCVSEVVANGEGISCLAFQLWEKAGCPEGRDLEFWLGAETYPAELEHRLDAAKASEAAEADSSSTSEEIQVRESTLMPIVEKFLRFQTFSH
jgi:Protein of unknown function (DUF2934)